MIKQITLFVGNQPSSNDNRLNVSQDLLKNGLHGVVYKIHTNCHFIIIHFIIIIIFYSDKIYKSEQWN